MTLETIAAALRVSQLRSREGGQAVERETATTLATLAGELRLRDEALSDAERSARV